MHSWLRLVNLQLPARATNALVERFGSADALFAADPSELADTDGWGDRYVDRLTDPTFAPTPSQLRALEQTGAKVVAITDPAYPARLREIPDPPTVLFVRGALDERDRFAVGVVGSRLASAYGRSVAERLGRDLAEAGITVVSGGALGIDKAAHDGAVAAGGRTLAVLGCGLDVEYPRDNQALFRRIREGCGALLSEFPMGATPEPWHFPQRNRIISGLAMGVVVVEAGNRSGALLTATMAAEQGRDVMAVPGNIDRPTSRGTNGLIRDGAALIENAGDVMRALGMLVLEPPPASAQPGLPLGDVPDARRRVLEALTLSPRNVDSISAEVGLSTAEAGVELTMLEMSGLARRVPGNCYIRAL